MCWNYRKLQVVLRVVDACGIWDVVSGPYKAKYGLLLVDKGVAKGAGKR